MTFSTSVRSTNSNNRSCRWLSAEDISFGGSSRPGVHANPVRRDIAQALEQFAHGIEMERGDSHARFPGWIKTGFYLSSICASDANFFPST